MKHLKTLFILIVLACNVTVMVAAADRQSEVTQIPAPQSSNSDSLIDLTREELPPYQSPIVVDEEDELENWVDDEYPILPTSIWSPSRFSLSYRPSSALNDIRDVVGNRVDFRAQWKYKFFQKIAVTLDGKVIALFKHDQGLDADKNYEIEGRIREYFMQTRGFLDLKLGYQVIDWSKFESMPMVDQMSPWDYSEFIFTARDDARVGQPALLIDFVRDWGSLTLVVNPLPKTNIYPVTTQHYLPQNDETRFTVKQTSLSGFSKDETEIGFRWLQKFASSDISFTMGHVLENEPIFVSEGVDQNGNNVLVETFPAFQTIGFIGNVSDGNFLWKAETAYNFNRTLSEIDKKDTLDSGIGIEYNTKGYSINLEWVYNYIIEGKGTQLLSSLNQFTARWSKSFLNDAISAVYYSNYELETGSRLQSGALRFAINDFFKTEINVTVFDLGQSRTSLYLSDSFRQLALKLSAIF